MTKKVLSLALAVAMLLSVFAFSANAAVESGKIGVRLESTATNETKAGDTVYLYCYFDFPANTDFTTYRQAISNITFAYNSAYYTYVGDRTFGTDYAPYVKDSSNINVNALTPAKLSTEEATIYDKAIMVQQAYQTSTEFGAKTGFEITDPDAWVWKIKFTAAQDITDTSVAAQKFIIPAGSIGSATKPSYCNVGVGSVSYTADNVYLSNVHVANAATKARLVGAVAGGNVDIGFTATIKGVGSFANGPITGITEIGFKYSTTETTVAGIIANGESVESKTLYASDSDFIYQYRVVLGNCDPASTTAFNAVAYAICNGVTYYADTVVSATPSVEAARIATNY